MQMEYRVVDVFTREPLKGNPLAVVWSDGTLTAEQMQAIAREFHLSETTFIERRPVELERAEGVRVRIFTPVEELPFAGHPTLGTAAVLRAEAPETVVDGVVRLSLKVGTVPVAFSSDGTEGEMTQRDPEFGPELDPHEVARLIGLEVEDLDPQLSPQIVSTGTAFAIVVLRSAEPLSRLRVDQPVAAPWLRERGARWFYVMGPSQEPGVDYRARMQFYGGEDPATGSAAGCAISYLVGCGAVASDRRIHVRQGVEIDRGSDLFLCAQRLTGKVGQVRVGGSTVLVASGRLFLS